MLALSRKVGEAIQVSGPCRIVIDRLGVGRVKLIFEAPEETRIMREELVPVSDGEEGDEE